MTSPRVCLNMIVKDEEHVIRRCLGRVRGHFDHWVIVDTGSTDATREIIREELADVPGTLVERPWKDFGHNRTEALEFARQSGCDYAFIIDADEEFLADEGFHWPEPMTADAYEVRHESGVSETVFRRTQVVRLALPWRYVGVLHEVIVCPGAARPQQLSGVHIHGRFDSARNKDARTKYQRDAEVLERAVVDEPENARYRFYLAQSYRDCQRWEDAERNYAKRATMGGWEEEIYFSLFEVGAMRMRRQRPEAEIVEAFLAAYENRPTRVEPLVSLAYYYRTQKSFGRAYIYAKAALGESEPSDTLFVDSGAYRWRAADEFAIAAYWTGRYAECKRVCEGLLAGDALPEAHRARVQKNLDFANGKLQS